MLGGRYAVGIGIIVILAGLFPPGSYSDPDQSSLDGVPVAGSCYRFARKDKVLFRKINASRRDHNLTPYKLDPELSQVARKHTEKMIDQEKIFHDTATNSARTTRWLAFGENVGRGQTVATQHSSYMDSVDHRKNILHEDLSHVGIAAKVAPSGELFTTELFTRIDNPGTTLGKPRC
jgi:uncharacterized protein YkwD